MARSQNIPNRENVSLADLEVAMKASPRQRGYVRMSTIRSLCLGFSHQEIGPRKSLLKKAQNIET